MPIILDLAYLFALLLLSPWLVWRAVRTGRYRRDLSAKLFGRVSINNPENKPVAWFHGVSVGEVHLLVTVVAAFRKRHPEYHVVVSSTTDTGLAEASAKFTDCSVIAYPFDFSWACSIALKRVNPKIVLLAESEFWPNFLRIANRYKVPVMVFNARMSPRSFGRLKKVGGIARKLLLNRITHFGVQYDDYAERLKLLGVPESKLTVTGSVKYDGATGDRDTPKARELRQSLNLGNEVIWVAGSTHAPEEEIVLDTFSKLRPRFPELHLILVPRHPDRFNEVAGLIEQSGIPFARRSTITVPLAEMPAILLLDTIGELGAAWSLAHLGYTGGSLDGKRGGQSMIEPAGYGVPTVFGPHVWNFRDAAKRLVEVGGAKMIPDAAGLENAVAELLMSPALRVEMASKARRLVTEQQGATERTLNAVDLLLPSPLAREGLGVRGSS